jgi:predicted DNA binding CopG/RHH family protein
MRKSIEVSVVADRVEEDEVTSAMITRMETEADREIAGGTVTLRWGKDQIEVIKRAAGIMGIPYQTYLKQVVFRQAVADIEQAESVLKN